MNYNEEPYYVEHKCNDRGDFINSLTTTTRLGFEEDYVYLHTRNGNKIIRCSYRKPRMSTIIKSNKFRYSFRHSCLKIGCREVVNAVCEQVMTSSSDCPFCLKK
jgi:hypothetical protein